MKRWAKLLIGTCLNSSRRYLANPMRSAALQKDSLSPARVTNLRRAARRVLASLAGSGISRSVLIFLSSLLPVMAMETRPPAPEAIVVAGGVVAEVLVELGFEDRIVAVDSSSTYPENLIKEKSMIGYVRALPAEGILSVNADCLMTTEDAGPPPVMQQLRATQLRIEQVPVTYTIAGAAERIRAIGVIMHAEDQAAELAQRLVDGVAAAQQTAGETDVRGLYLLHLRAGAGLGAGFGTSGDSLLRLAGVENAASSIKGWKPLSAESLAALAPDFIIADASEIKRMGGIDAVAALPGINLTPAGKNKRILQSNHGFMLSFGPRLPQAVAAVAEFAAGTSVK
jgi:iron complex transport system substrate-binding protein